VSSTANEDVFCQFSCNFVIRHHGCTNPIGRHFGILESQFLSFLVNLLWGARFVYGTIIKDKLDNESVLPCMNIKVKRECVTAG
jgi:hypothetical protein